MKRHFDFLSDFRRNSFNVQNVVELVFPMASIEYPGTRVIGHFF